MSPEQHQTLSLLVVLVVLILFLGVKGRGIWKALLTPGQAPALNLNPLSGLGGSLNLGPDSASITGPKS